MENTIRSANTPAVMTEPRHHPDSPATSSCASTTSGTACLDTALLRPLTWLAALFAMLVAVLPPLIYWQHASRSIDAELDAQLAYLSGVLQPTMLNAPKTWAFEREALEGHLRASRALAADPAAGSLRIADLKHTVLAESVSLAPGPMRLRRAHLHAGTAPVGLVMAERSAQPVMSNTLLMAAFSLVLGLGTFLLVRGLPQRVVRRPLHALREEKEKAEVTLASIGDAVLTLEGGNRVGYVNPAAEKLTGWGRREAVGRPLEEVVELRETQAERAAHAVPPLYRPDTRQGEAVVVARDGQRHDVEFSAAPIGTGFDRVLVIRNISERKESERKLSHMANFDSLTGLPNRAMFRELLTQAMARVDRHGGMLALMFLDLDRFKWINDSLGHEAGDLLLTEVANRLRQVLRRSDTVARGAPDTGHNGEHAVARLGGDEFTVIADGLKRPDQAAIVGRRILDALATPVNLNGTEIFVSTSIGIALYPAENTPIDALIKNADSAMYRAKEMGRGNYQFYTDDLNERARQRLELEADLRRAVERGEFKLLYQPKMAIATGEIVGVEALLRWHSPTRGPVSPMDFLGILEETGLIVDVARWVLREACTQAQRWRQGGHPLRMAVNLAARNLRNDELLFDIANALEQSGLEAGLLEVELTEAMLMAHGDQAHRALTGLRSLGVRLSIDDFGTGYSSLSALRRMPVDSLKIDRSFVQHLPDSLEDVAIARAVIALARTLRLAVVAEGVENDAQLEFLRAEGCNLVQGYRIGQPMSGPDLEGWLTARGASPQATPPRGHLPRPAA